MNLYLISQTANSGYDTYDAAVVAAPNEATARQTNPSAYGRENCQINWSDRQWYWCDSPADVTVELIGTDAHPELGWRVILASYNAG